jgi:hypothetical protein
LISKTWVKMNFPPVYPASPGPYMISVCSPKRKPSHHWTYPPSDWGNGGLACMHYVCVIMCIYDTYFSQYIAWYNEPILAGTISQLSEWKL